MILYSKYLFKYERVIRVKTAGLLGGMSWESTLEYYRIINQETKRLLGESHSARCLLYSFDFHEVEVLQHEGRWEELTGRMVQEAMNLKKAGADFIAICTNTMHLMARDIEQATGLKVVHIADAAGEAVKASLFSKVALLGTRFTMEGDFYRKNLLENHGIQTLIPDDSDRELIHQVIYTELIRGIISERSRNEFVRIIGGLADRGAEGVILGCTEIPLLISDEVSPLPVFDTTRLHSEAIVKYAIT